MLATVLLGLQAGPGLLDISDNISWRGADLQLLQTAGETTGVAAERSVEVENLPLRIVQDDHVERSGRAADVSGAAVSVLLGFVDVLVVRGVNIARLTTIRVITDLAQDVLYFVFVGGLEPGSHHCGDGLQHLFLLLDDELVYHGEVLQP